MSLLNDVYDALAGIDSRVYYGIATQLPDGSPWDYTVFARERTRNSDTRNGFSDVVAVAITREEYVPDGLPEQVIEAMCRIPGMRLSSDDWEYAYALKNGTRQVVEQCIITFTRARKR